MNREQESDHHTLTFCLIWWVYFTQSSKTAYFSKLVTGVSGGGFGRSAATHNLAEVTFGRVNQKLQPRREFRRVFYRPGGIDEFYIQ